MAVPAPGARGSGARSSRQGLAELMLVTGFLAVAAAGAVAIFGDELRAAFGGPTRAPAPQAAPAVPAR